MPALIGLGSNLGDRGAVLDGAIAALRATPGVRVVAVSSFWETAAVGGPSGQGSFQNAAASLETSLGPWELLGELRRVESGSGRVRRVRWGPRTLDLDLLFFGDARIGRDSVPAWPSVPLAPGPESLVVPHPRAAFRRFVLGPLAEVAADFVDPVSGRTIRELLERLDRRPSRLGLAGDWSDAEGLDFLDRLRASLADDWLVSSGAADPPTLVLDRLELRRSIRIAPGFDPLAELVAICRGTRGS